jgi:hypothetical protein
VPKPLVFVLAVVSLVVVSAGLSQIASPLKYRQETVAAQDGKPVLRLTNTSALPITAYVVVRSRHEDPEVQGRSYHDSCIFGRVEKPIANGESTLESAGDQIDSHFEMVRTEVRAVVFEDGSTAGDSSWIDAILARRLRFCDRLMSVHDLLKQQIGTGAMLPAIIDNLQSAEASAHQQLPDDDLRVMDDTVFIRAISTMQANSKFGYTVDYLVGRYLKILSDQTSELNRCQPAMDAIRMRLANRPNREQPIVPPHFPH